MQIKFRKCAVIKVLTNSMKKAQQNQQLLLILPKKYVNISLLGGEVVRKTYRGVVLKFTLCMRIVNVSILCKMRKIMFVRLNTNMHYTFPRYR